jgi:FixJ family two-component response regulator
MSPSGQTGDMTDPLVVVIDDDDDIREAVKDAIERAGFATATAANGWDGLEILRARARHEPCIALLDLMMPVMDGLEMLWRIEAEGLRVHVIVMTAFLDAPVPPGIVRLAKPVAGETLLAAVRDAAAQLTPHH